MTGAEHPGRLRWAVAAVLALSALSFLFSPFYSRFLLSRRPRCWARLIRTENARIFSDNYGGGRYSSSILNGIST